MCVISLVNQTVFLGLSIRDYKRGGAYNLIDKCHPRKVVWFTRLVYDICTTSLVIMIAGVDMKIICIAEKYP